MSATGFADGYAGLFPREPRNKEYLRQYTRGRDARLAEHRTFSDAAVITPGMISGCGNRVMGSGVTANQSVGRVEC